MVGGNRIKVSSDWPSQIFRTSGVITAAPIHNNTDKIQDTSVKNKKVNSIFHFQDDESNKKVGIIVEWKGMIEKTEPTLHLPK